MYRIVILIIISLLFLGCGADTGNQADNKQAYQVQDDYGNIVKFDAKPQRIYATTISLEELLLDLVPAEHFAAISQEATDERYSLVKDKADRVAKKVPIKLNVENIVALRPDLVIAQENLNKAQIEAMKEAGLKVYVVKVPTDAEMIEKRITNIAKAVGEEKRGNELIKAMNEKLQYVKKVTGDIPIEKRKIVMAYSLMGVFGSKEGLFNDICENAGVRNGAALAGLVRGEHLSKEKIVAVNPDLFIFPIYSSTREGDADKFREEVLSDKSLATVKAVKNKSYILINDRYRYTTSHLYADSVYEIASKSYPKLFAKKKK